MSIPASPASSLPPVSDCWMRTFSSSGVSPSSRFPLVRTPITRSTAFDTPLSSDDERVEDPGEDVQRARDEAGDGLGRWME